MFHQAFNKFGRGNKYPKTTRKDKKSKGNKKESKNESDDDENKKKTKTKTKTKTKIKTYTTEDKSWDMETETIEKCPHMEDEQEVIIVKKAKHKIEAMMDIMENDEWIGMLVGDNSEEKWKVKDLHIPEQKVSGANAKKTDMKEPKKTIGVIHSHHSMGSFFSGTDEDNVNKNYNLSLVIDSDFKFEGMAREKTECGKMARKKVDIKIESEYDPQKEWAKKVKDENITKKTYGISKISKFWKKRRMNRKNKDNGDDDEDANKDEEGEGDEKELSHYEIWDKIEEKHDDEDVDFNELYDEYEEYLRKAGYFDDDDDDEDEDWDFETGYFDDEDEDEDWNFVDDVMDEAEAEADVKVVDEVEVENEEEDSDLEYGHDTKKIDLDKIDDEDIHEIAVAAVDAPRIRACELNFVDWLSINKPYEYENYYNKTEQEKTKLIKEYLRYAEVEEVDYINNDDIPDIEMFGVKFDEWLRENKSDIYFVWNEVDIDVKDELIKKFGKYAELRQQNTDN